MTWLGMNASTGRTITEMAHIRQSVRDILSTPVGTRVMRRDYGSDIFELIDGPLNGVTRMRLMTATVMALLRWEPRIKVTALSVDSIGMDGSLVITITAQRTDGQRATSATFNVEVPR